MSVTLQRAEEVFMEKAKAYVAKQGSTIEDYQTIGDIYSEYCWGSFDKETGITQVESWGGEGEGDSIGYTIKYEVDGETIYLKITGFYDSWNGTEWADGVTKLVRPVERMVTFYE